MITHFGDPCIHCGVGHDDAKVGPCKGNRSKAKILAYCVDLQRWENSGVERVLCRMSTGEIRPEHFNMGCFWLEGRFEGAEVLSRQEFRDKYKV